MLRSLKRLLLLLLIAAAAYCFWPRASSLAAFDPETMARLQVDAWKAQAGKNRLDLILHLYGTYAGQLHIPPVSSARLALGTSRALGIFHSARDAADQEKALEPLQKIFTIIRDSTGETFDVHAAARLELMIWTLRASHAKRADLTAVWSDLLALLYGKPAAATLQAAKKFALASNLADEGKWEDARAAALSGWKAVKALRQK